MILFASANSRCFLFWFLLCFFHCLPQLIEEEQWGKGATPPESSIEDEESTDSGGEDSGDSSDDVIDGDHNSEHEKDSPKVDITG
jgi:hypothetical protein